MLSASLFTLTLALTRKLLLLASVPNASVPDTSDSKSGNPDMGMSSYCWPVVLGRPEVREDSRRAHKRKDE
jgi:hypothetical protein